jgi:hypothetical protein
MDYATASLADVRSGLDDLARETAATFGRLTPQQLNWRPDVTRWSVAQCLEHVIMANQLMFQAADQALSNTARRTVWQRLPILPAVLGRMLVRSQAPTSERRFTAPVDARPAASAISADVLRRFVDQHRDAVKRLQALDEETAARAIMTSPFIRIVAYSVLDGWRLVFAHGRRHVQQARHVTLSPGFPV